jgi:hypothetical protein
MPSFLSDTSSPLSSTRHISNHDSLSSSSSPSSTSLSLSSSSTFASHSSHSFQNDTSNFAFDSNISVHPDMNIPDVIHTI